MADPVAEHLAAGAVPVTTARNADPVVTTPRVRLRY